MWTTRKRYSKVNVQINLLLTLIMIRLYVVPKGTTVNSARYMEILETRMLPSASHLYPTEDFIFQHDGTPCHRSKAVKSWFQDHGVTPMHNWPSQSPDINPIENVWCIMNRMISMNKPTGRVNLIEEVIKAWNHTCSIQGCLRTARA